MQNEFCMKKWISFDLTLIPIFLYHITLNLRRLTMKDLFRLFILFFVFGIVITCKKENEAPLIQSTIANPNSIKKGETTQLTCAATDPDGDRLFFSWSSSAGIFLNGTEGSSVSWQAPEEPGIYTILVNVDDGHYKVDGTASIEVVQSANLEGFVYYAGTSIPVPGVTVSINDVSFTTNESGQFILQNIAVGDAEIVASKLNFNPYSKIITINGNTNFFNIEMTTDTYAHSVSGFISDENDNKIAGVLVLVLNPDGSFSNLQTNSDSTGYFQLQSVPQGTRSITFEKEGYHLFQAGILISNNDYDYNVKLESLKISGNILDYEGNSISGAVIAVLKSDDSQTNFTTTSGETGFYQLKNVPQGKWILVIEKEGYATEESEIIVSYNNGLFGYDVKLFTTFTDNRDNKKYKIVRIGDQVWMAENLAYLPAVSPATIGSGNEPFYYVFNYNGTDINIAKTKDNYLTYGVLYNWPAALTACPNGWHLPSKEEWSELALFLSSNGYGYGDGWDHIAKSLAAKTKWHSHSIEGSIGFDLESNNSSGFSALPGGFRNSFVNFSDIGLQGNWWSATEFDTNYVWLRGLYYSDFRFSEGYVTKDHGVCIRCLQDKP